mmetsp:Transcript_21651/g.51723  ORF Transcript_21651/g.51723 Transcript_21651/m.51723 type:complete len:492 (+) Transcript_21651:180-1655(+)
MWQLLIAGISTLAAGIFFVLALTHNSKAKLGSSLPLPPGNTGIPILRDVLTLVRIARSYVNPLLAYVKTEASKHGCVFRGTFPPLIGSGIFVASPEALRFVFNHENRGFVVDWPATVKNLLGPNSISVVLGDTHKRLRSYVIKSFSPRNLRSYLPTVDILVRSHFERLGSQRIVVHKEMKKLTFKVAADLILGADHSDQDLVTELEKLFRVLFAGPFSLAPWLPGGAYSKAVAARRQILQRLKAVLSKRRSGESSGRADVLGTLLSSPSLADDSKPMTDEEICDVVINLLFAGHDTSSCALTWVFWYLSQHPAVLEAVRAEQVAVAESAGEGLTWEDIERMTYTEQVLKEVIRITPPIGGVSRKTAQDTEYSGMRFPGGCPVFCSIGYVHSSPELFPEPHKFDPSRFAGGDPPEFTPFGGGGRMCLGMHFSMMEMKCIVHHLCTQFEWSVAPDAAPGRTFYPIPLPKDGLPVLLSRKTATEAQGCASAARS